jgi:hypothetical protein
MPDTGCRMQDVFFSNAVQANAIYQASWIGHPASRSFTSD